MRKYDEKNKRVRKETQGEKFRDNITETSFRADREYSSSSPKDAIKAT